MKNAFKLVVAGLFCLGTGLNAATINIGGATAGRLAVLTPDGTPVTDFLTAAGSYHITVGHFATDPTFNPADPQNSYNSILGSFIALRSNAPGTPVFTVAAPAGGLLAAGFVNGNSPSSLDGKQIYVFLTDTANLADATQFAVLKSPLLFPNPVSGSGTTNTTSSVTGLLSVIGTVTNVPATPVNPGDSTRDYVTLVAVPEPSVALLGALGALGLIRRRR